MLKRLAIVAGAAAAAVGLAFVGWSWWTSRLPGTYSVMDYGSAEFGGGAAAAAEMEHARMGHGTSVTTLTGPRGAPDRRFVLTARRATIRLSSGREIDALTFGLSALLLLH